jgi:hypothetical protein
MAASSTQACLLLQKQLKGADPSNSPVFPPTLSAGFSFLVTCGLIDWGTVCCMVDADLSKNPVDGFSAGLVDDSNVFEWQVTIIGPPDTL